jgi:hypothetical protein
MAWITIDNAYGTWEIAGESKTKADAIEKAVRNCCTGYKSSKIKKSVYEIRMNSSCACACKKEKLEELGYTN